MTDSNQAREFVKRAGRAALGPVTARLDLVRRDLDDLRAAQQQMNATIEQVEAANARLEAYVDRFREELRAEYAPTLDDVVGARGLLAELAPQDPASAGAALRERLDHTLLHAEAMAAEAREQFATELGDVRSTTRLTQALVERALQLSDLRPAATDGSDPAPRHAAPAEPAFDHPVPSFDLLYRAFEDRHRGDDQTITNLQEEDYLDLLVDLPNPELSIADLGCGRGELVRLLDRAGLRAVGVDANQGQLVEGDERLFVELDLFRWLDRQADSSHRAVLAMHVVEHLPLDLQIRLVFEAHRVLAPGGLLVLETPNALSIGTAATNFWVDPTHHRPVHPAFLEFLATEAGFSGIELKPLHPVPLHFRGGAIVPELVEDLDSLILGSGDMALLARR